MKYTAGTWESINVVGNMIPLSGPIKGPAVSVVLTGTFIGAKLSVRVSTLPWLLCQERAM